jgi:hypothetical protein
MTLDEMEQVVRRWEDALHLAGDDAGKMEELLDMVRGDPPREREADAPYRQDDARLFAEWLALVGKEAHHFPHPVPAKCWHAERQALVRSGRFEGQVKAKWLVMERWRALGGRLEQCIRDWMLVVEDGGAGEAAVG